MPLSCWFKNIAFLEVENTLLSVKTLVLSGLNNVKLALAPTFSSGSSPLNLSAPLVRISIVFSVPNSLFKAPKQLSNPTEKQLTC